MYLILDCETTGLPKSRSQTYKCLSNYDSCRMVSVAWLVYDKNFNIITEKEYYITPPDNLTIPREATKIHGITKATLKSKGKDFNMVMYKLAADILEFKCEYFIGHNVYFDFNVLCSELHRNHHRKIINMLFTLKKYCTMVEGRRKYKLKSPPKLADLYQQITKCPMIYNHNALYDVRATSEIFKFLNQ
jgi:DNA polymerase III epsilon subunit-like protein